MGALNKNIEQGESQADKNKLIFSHLPGFSHFLLENHLEDFSRIQLQFSFEEEIPLMKFFTQFSQDQLQELAVKGASELLTVISENRCREYISKAANDYASNIIPYFERESVVSEDITSISLVRRKALRHFLPLYTTDLNTFAIIMEELDRFIAASESSSFNAFIDIQLEKVQRVNIQLEESRADYLEAQKLTDMGSFLWDMKNGKSVFSEGLLRIFDLEAPTKLEAFFECVHIEDKELLQRAMEKAIHGDGLYDCEYRYVKNGIEKRIWSRGVVHFEDGKAAFMKGTIRDVTNRHLLLEQLQRSEEANNHAQALTHIGNWSWDISSGKITWSDEMYRIYGLDPQSEEIRFERFISFIHPDDRQQRLDEIQSGMETGIVKDYSMRIVNPDGKQKILSGKGEIQKDHKGKLVKMLGTCQDITKEFNLNMELREKEENLKQLIDNAPDAVIVIDADFAVTLWNPKTVALFGIQEKEVIGKDLVSIIFPKQIRHFQRTALKKMLAHPGNPKENVLELEVEKMNGQAFFVSLTLSPFVQKDIQYYILFLRDISNEKNDKAELQSKSLELETLNASLKNKNTELERINKELESFNYIASHDLQEPLRKIKTFTLRLLDKEKKNLPAASSEFLNKIMNSADRMQKLIEDLLMFSQTTANQHHFEVTDLNLIAEEVKSLLSEQIAYKQATVQNTGLPTLRVIPFQFRQLFLNIIENAIKYSRPDLPPVVKISSRLIPGSKVRDTLALHAVNYVEINIADNGIGFENENSEKIFGLFQRLHNKDKYTGTGIGLSICKKIAHIHNGFILAKGKPGAGSEFSIYIPDELSVQRKLVN